MRLTIRPSLFASLLIAFACNLNAVPVLDDDFETLGLTFSPDWGVIERTDIFDDGGAQGTDSYASILPPEGGLNGQLGLTIENGASDLIIDFHTRIFPTGGRRFNLIVSVSEAIVVDQPAINLRYQNNAWAVFSGSWQTLSGLPQLTPDVWYRVRVTCRGWGDLGASYDIEVSDADGDVFTSEATGLTFFQTGDPSATPINSIIFNTAFGGNPGFEIDEVVIETDEAPQVDDPNIVFDSFDPFTGFVFEANPDSETVDVIIENTGSANDLFIADTTAFSGSSAGSFNVETDLPITIPPGQETTIAITFDADGGSGLFNAILNIESNDASNPSLPLPVSTFVPSSDGNLLGNSDFEESNTSLPKWTLIGEPTAITGFAPNSSTAANVLPGTEISQQLIGSEGDWTADFYFQVEDSAGRLLNFVTNYPGGSVNIRYEDSVGWNAFTEDDQWGDPLPNLPLLEFGPTYFMRVIGRGWTTATPTFDLLLSNPGELELVNRLEGSTRFRSGPPETLPNAGPFRFSFSAVNGNSPGFRIDDARLTNGAPPLEEVDPSFAITDFAYSPDTGEVTITWNAVPMTDYIITESTDLLTWTEAADSTATSAQESVTITGVQPGLRFFRVEESPNP